MQWGTCRNVDTENILKEEGKERKMKRNDNFPSKVHSASCLKNSSKESKKSQSKTMKGYKLD